MPVAPNAGFSEPRRMGTWLWFGWAVLGACLSSLSPACARTASEALTKGLTYPIPAVTYCTSQNALRALVAMRHDNDLDSLPSGCFSPTQAAFAQQFRGFIPDHKVAGMAVREKLNRPNRFGQSTCSDATTGASIKCDVHVVLSGFLAGTLVGADSSRTPAFIEVGDGIEVIDPRSGDLIFAPLT